MSIVFILLSVMTLIGALAAATMRNTVHCALALTIVFAGLACLYLNLGAEFVGLAQILVYIGAVAILVVFAVLLTRGSEPSKDKVFSHTWPLGIVIGAGVFALLGWAVLHSGSYLPHATETPHVTVLDIGQALMSSYVLPLEIVAILLTAATLGAVIVAMHEKEDAK